MKKIVLLLLLISFNNYAESLRLVTGEFPPFVGKDLKNGGTTSELIKLIFTKMDTPIEIIFKPWKRGYSETLNGQYLGTFPYTKNKDREQDAYFSDAMYHLKEYFFALRKANLNYTKPADLTNLTICKPIGYNLFGLKTLFENKIITLARPKSMNHCFKMLALGRVDLVMTNPIIGTRLIKETFTNPNDAIRLEKRFVQIGHYLIIPKSTPKGEAIITQFNHVLKQLKDQGIVQLIQQKNTQ
jgi:polar amino acid transport system substrate-binding protein